MEHRLNDRLPLAVDAEIYKAGEKLGSFSVKDIGTEGLCVENRESQLGLGNFLEVVLPTFGRRTRTNCVMNALVIWAKNEYAGLIWANVNNEFTCYFNEISAAAA